jgi:hypothetical protein
MGLVIALLGWVVFVALGTAVIVAAVCTSRQVC